MFSSLQGNQEFQHTLISRAAVVSFFSVVLLLKAPTFTAGCYEITTVLYTGYLRPQSCGPDAKPTLDSALQVQAAG